MGLLDRLLRRRVPDGEGVPLAPALAAHRAAQAGRDPRALLDACAFVVLDTELTGFDPRRHALVSIGAVRLSGLEILPGQSFYSLVRPQGDVPRDASLVHRLTAAGLEEAPGEAEVLERFLHFLGDAIIVGHHVDLDMGFLNAASRRRLGGPLEAPCIDTLRLAMAFEEKRLAAGGRAGEAESLDYTLPALCRRFGLPQFAAHDARADALAAAYLFVYLARKSARGRPLGLDGLWRAGRAWWR
ncbi:3'-5' exonuclease [Solidesulfovibrio sp.]|uniref:3'-5' exonuclease n=1 Tax=Solidesulfovibrio sp. TaxID=2910990 RepID=UPI00262EE069|nr:3'-5' exonuclease [Solidesulfovibrio sp.]